MSDQAFREWFKITHGIVPSKLGELNWCAQLKQSWNASCEQTVNRIIEILEKQIDLAITAHNGCAGEHAIDEIKKEFGVKYE